MLLHFLRWKGFALKRVWNSCYWKAIIAICTFYVRYRNLLIFKNIKISNISFEVSCFFGSGAFSIIHITAIVIMWPERNRRHLHYFPDCSTLQNIWLCLCSNSVSPYYPVELLCRHLWLGRDLHFCILDLNVLCTEDLFSWGLLFHPVTVQIILRLCKLRSGSLHFTLRSMETFITTVFSIFFAASEERFAEIGTAALKITIIESFYTLTPWLLLCPWISKAL